MSTATFKPFRPCRHGLMVFDAGDDSVGRALELYGDHQIRVTDIFAQVVKRGHLAIEIGAHVGAHTLCLAKLVGETGAVLAIEPSPQDFQTLCANIAVNELKHVFCRQAPAWIPGTRRDPARQGKFIEQFKEQVTQHATGSQRVELPCCQFVKLEMLNAMPEHVAWLGEILRRQKPLLYIANTASALQDDLLEWLSSTGYEAYRHSTRWFDGGNFRGNQMNVFGNKRSDNLICVPAGPQHSLSAFERVAMPTERLSLTRPIERLERNWQQLRRSNGDGFSPGSNLETLVDFDSLKEEVRKLNESRQGPVATTGAELLKSFGEALDSVDCVSFNIFNTLLLRRSGDADTILHHLETADAFKKLPPLGRPIAELRRAAGQKAREVARKCRGTDQIRLGEVYDAFCRIHQLPLSKAAELMEAEESLELDMCGPNPRIFKLYELAKAKGKTIAAMTDGHHRREFLARLLGAHGFSIDANHVFVSCDRGVTRADGPLFSRMLQHLNLRGAQVLHVGIDRIADYQSPRAEKLRAMLHPDRACPPLTESSADPAAARTEGFVLAATTLGSVDTDNPDDFWRELGHNAFGPLLCAFSQSLRRSQIRDRLNRVYFLSGYGEILQSVHEALFGRDAIHPTQKLACSSRDVVFTAFAESPALVEPMLLAECADQPIDKYLETYGLDARTFEGELQVCGFKGTADIIQPGSGVDSLRLLLYRPRVLKALRDQAELRKAALIAHLQSAGFFAGGKCVLADLGLNNSAQKVLHSLLARQNSATQLTGRYVIAPRRPLSAVADDSPDRSSPARADEANIFSQNEPSFIEFLKLGCCSTGSPMAALTNPDAIVSQPQPPDSQSDEISKRKQSIRDGILAFAEYVRDNSQKFHLSDLSAPLASRTLLRIHKNPTKAEATMLGSLPAPRNSPAASHHLARFRETSRTADAVLKDYEDATWKAGLLNQESPQALLLRGVLWMMGK